MKVTGSVRRIDRLGRFVLPMDLRRDLDISEGDVLEITVDGTEVVLRKSRPKCRSVSRLVNHLGTHYKDHFARELLRGFGIEIDGNEVLETQQKDLAKIIRLG